MKLHFTCALSRRTWLRAIGFAVLSGNAVNLLAATTGRKKTFTATVTAYCGCPKCCAPTGLPLETASGTSPKQGRTLAGPRRLKFGSKVTFRLLNSNKPKAASGATGTSTNTCPAWVLNKTFIIEDRLAVKYDSRFDIFMDNHEDALKFGKHQMLVTITVKTP